MRAAYALLLLLWSAAASAQNVPEYLATMPLPGLAPRTQERPGVAQTDWLPPGVTADDAARMVTVERISGAGGAEGPMRFIRGLTICLRPCPGQPPVAIDQSPVSGHPAARARIDIAADFRGRPSRTYALAVSGERDLHVVIVVIRGAISGADADFAQSVLRSAVLCGPRATAPACDLYERRHPAR